MNKRLRKIASFTFRWGIAIVGIWWVISNMSIADHALHMTASDARPVEVVVKAESPSGYEIQRGGQTLTVSGAELVNPPDREKVKLSDGRELYLAGMDLGDEKPPVARRLLVSESVNGPTHWISPDEVQDDFHLRVPHPRVEVGLRRMVLEANPWLLVLSVAIFPITIFITSVRWRRLLEALEIKLSLWRTAVLNMVGLFYNTFIPMGSTGGDLLKAYYASKHTQYKTRAVMSVIVDRVIGLIVLIILGGVIAGGYWLAAENKMDPAVRACAQVGTMAVFILLGLAVGLSVAFNVRLRKLTGLERILARLPMQRQVQDAIEVMAIYRQRPSLVLWAMLITFPVHITVIISALLAGKAFGLPLSWGYYFVVVPVTVLVGAIPISPQGAGVMEFFAINLTARQGATISQAFALTMSLRVVQILWNLAGGVFVLSGHYRAPAAEEIKQTVP